MVSSGGTVYIDSAGHDMYAIRVSDDNVLWHKQYTDNDLLFGLSAANDGTLYFASTTILAASISLAGQGITPTTQTSTSTPSTEVAALKASDGSLRWRWHPANNSGGSSDVLSIGNTAYLAIGNSLYALSEKDGTLLWTISAGSRLETPFTS
jgi:outer membrane protein assembly factor BamB